MCKLGAQEETAQKPQDEIHLIDFSKFPRRGYHQGETPIEPMPNLSRALGGKVNLFVKRDDLLPGAGGGNKTRKLDFCLADAVENHQADTIVTCGAVQSNHCRLTAAWCVKEQLECHLILEERVKGSYDKDASGNNFLFDLLNVKSRRVVPGGSDVMAAMEETTQALRAQGKKPYIIPGGASNSTGALGYADCAQEIMQQLHRSKLVPTMMDYIVVPSGSSGTHSGMVAGMAALDLLSSSSSSSVKIYGINTSRAKEEQEAKVLALATETAARLGVDDIPRDAVCCFGNYVGPGYSLPTPEMIEAVKLFAKTEAILLDPVYTGKQAAGLIDLIRTGVIPEGSNVLFLHTGGSPALYAYMDYFRESPSE